MNLIITDPPYDTMVKPGIKMKNKNPKTMTRFKQWFDVVSINYFKHIIPEFYRILKINSHCYIFCDSDTMPELIKIGEHAGFKFWKPLVWDKVNFGMGYHYRAQYEFILFFEKGKRKLNSFSIPDILKCKRIIGKYPTEKPIDLLKVLISQSSERNETVFDPFMGSGSTGVAALDLGRNFVGNDISTVARDLTIERLRYYV